MVRFQSKMIWTTFLIASAGLLLALASILPAYAAPLTPISGNFVFTVTGVTSDTNSSGNNIVKFTFSETLTGNIAGTRTGTGTQITYPDGSFNVRNCGTFVGTVLEIPGTAHDCATAQGAGNSFNGQFATTKGTGELAGSHVWASFVGGGTGPTTTAGTYSGEFVFGA